MAADTQGPDGSGYFLYHSIGQYAGKADDLRRAMDVFAASWGRADDGQWPVALGMRARFIDRWTALLKARPGTVTTCESVTAGLGALIGGLPDAALRGRQVLVAGDCFPSVHFLLQALAEPRGFQLVTVPLRPGATWVEDEDLRDAWGPEVGLALLTWVSSTSSHRSALAPLIAHGRAQGSLIGVDITQGGGLLPFDVSSPAIDFCLTTSLKWMCGTPGAGMLYVAPELVAKSNPTLCGWFSQPDPFNWDFDRFTYAPDIRRFDHGTPGVIAAAMSAPAMDWHAGQDHGAILDTNRRLSAMIEEGAAEMGLRFVSPRDPAQRGGSVMVELPEGLPGPDAVAGLRAEGLAADARSRTLRLSPGVMTRASGVERLISVLGGMVRRA